MGECTIDRFQLDLLDWSESELREFPWRDAERSQFHVLISEILLKQTRAETVANIAPKLYEQFPTPEAVTEASREEIVEAIRPLGIYNHRADAIIEIAEYLIENPFPASEEGLRGLPQVGPYVANATLCFGLDEPRPIVDSNVQRIYNRLLDTVEADKAYWQLAKDSLPSSDVRQYNLALLDFGAKICTDRSPKCNQCFATEYCGYYAGQKTVDGS